MNPINWINLAIGSIGAITGVIALIWNIFLHKPKVKLNRIIHISLDDKDGKLTEDMLQFVVINHREQPLKIQAFGFLFEDGGPYPYKPQEGADEIHGKDNMTFVINMIKLREVLSPKSRSLIKYLYVEDRVGNYYKAKLPKRSRYYLARNMHD